MAGAPWLALVLAACWTGDPPAPRPVPPASPPGPTVAELTPTGFDGIWLGMKLEDFRRVRPKVMIVNASETARREYFEDFSLDKVHPPNVVVALYFFGPTLPYPLYEIRVAYEDRAHAKFALDDRYVMRGLVTSPRQTAVDPDNDIDDVTDLSMLVTIKTTKFDVGAWVFKNRLVVAAALPFTERSDGRFGEPLR